MKYFIKSIVVLSMFLSMALAGLPKSSQTGVGTIDKYDAHGKIVYRFVPKAPNETELRLVKFIPSRIGYKKGLPEEMEAFFAAAVAKKQEVEIACEFFDKGAGSKTSIGTKIVSYQLVKSAKAK